MTSTYPEFVSFVQKFLIGYNTAEYSRIIDANNQINKADVISNIEKEEFIEYKLACGHLFDRLITEYVISEAFKSISSDTNPFYDIKTSEELTEIKLQEGGISVVDKQISVVYMLVALNMAVRSNAEERVESLFKTAQFISKMKEASNNMIGEEGDAGVVQNQGTASGLNEVKVEEQLIDSIIQDGDKDKNTEGYISVDSAHQIVDNLIHSWQVTIAFIFERYC